MASANTTAPTLADLSAAVRDVCASHPVARVQLFGSCASGRAHPGSDVDLLIEFLPGASIGLLEMGALKEDLEQRLGCSVDLVSRPAVERSRNPYRRRSILAAPITVYAR
ncbi:MAG TPA: nucleotidyltransferase domain-containing protein [Chthoniobacteraceae bacterium]|jgi:predicted nucleotidyltransferase|nr:nucleotidyltransferase domain-containing protein [Chthoniobacteraceae bacterium]